MTKLIWVPGSWVEGEDGTLEWSPSGWVESTEENTHTLNDTE